MKVKIIFGEGIGSYSVLINPDALKNIRITNTNKMIIAYLNINSISNKLDVLAEQIRCLQTF